MFANTVLKQSLNSRVEHPRPELQNIIFSSMGSSDYFPNMSAEEVVALPCAVEEKVVALPYSIGTQKLGVRTELVNSVLNLKHPPVFEQQFNGLLEVTIGDLHGNPLGFLHYLVKCGIFKFESTLSDVYQKILRIVARSSEDIPEFSRKDLLEFESLLPRLFPVQKKDVFVRLLGDILADRISNDILMLYVLKYLDRIGVSCEILFSNHDSYAVSYFCFEIDLAQDPIYDITKESLQHPAYGSLSRLMRLFNSNVLSRDEFSKLFSEVYLPKLKLLSYYKKADGSGCVFSHAILLNRVLIQFCQVYRQEMSEIEASVSGRESLEELIQKINSTFTYMLKNKSHKLLDDFLCLNTNTKGFENLVRLNPVYMCIWNRADLQRVGGFQFDLEKAQDPNLPIPNTVERVHGHTHNPIVNSGERQYTSLDQNAGKSESQFWNEADRSSVTHLHCVFHSFKEENVTQTQKTDDTTQKKSCIIC